MKFLGLILLLALAAPAVAGAAEPAGPGPAPPEIALPTPLIEQIYTYLQTKPYADVAPLIDGMRQAAAKATKPPAPPPVPPSPSVH